MFFLLANLPATKEKPPEVIDFRGLVVDKRFETSNLDLVNDLAKVVEYLNTKE
jgi:hypothetical protein